MLALHPEFFPIISEKFLSSRGTQDLIDLACLWYKYLTDVSNREKRQRTIFTKMLTSRNRVCSYTNDRPSLLPTCWENTTLLQVP